MVATPGAAPTPSTDTHATGRSVAAASSPCRNRNRPSNDNRDRAHAFTTTGKTPAGTALTAAVTAVPRIVGVPGVRAVGGRNQQRGIFAHQSRFGRQHRPPLAGIGSVRDHTRPLPAHLHRITRVDRSGHVRPYPRKPHGA